MAAATPPAPGARRLLPMPLAPPAPNPSHDDCDSERVEPPIGRSSSARGWLASGGALLSLPRRIFEDALQRSVLCCAQRREK